MRRPPGFQADVADAVGDVGGERAETFEEDADAGADVACCDGGCVVGAVNVGGKSSQVGEFVVVEDQRPGEGVDDGGAGVSFAAAFEANVVVDAHAGECGEFFATQPRGAAESLTALQADHFGGDALTS